MFVSSCTPLCRFKQVEVFDLSIPLKVVDRLIRLCIVSELESWDRLITGKPEASFGRDSSIGVVMLRCGVRT